MPNGQNFILQHIDVGLGMWRKYSDKLTFSVIYQFTPDARNVRRILVRGVNAPLPPEVYLNKYVVSVAPFSTPACPDCSQNIT